MEPGHAARRVSSRRRARARRRRAAPPHPDAAFIAGGTALLQLFKLGAAAPGAPGRHQPACRSTAIQRRTAASLRIGALVRHSRPRPPSGGPARLAGCSPQAIEASASPQLRNLATVGGNLLQRTRCAYFRDAPTCPVTSAHPGSGCSRPRPARTGGTRSSAAARPALPTHPSDLGVALLALDARCRCAARLAAGACCRSPSFTAPGDSQSARTCSSRATSSSRSRCRHRRGPSLALPQGAGPRLLRVRPGLGGGRPGASRTHVFRAVRLAAGGVAHRTVAAFGPASRHWPAPCARAGGLRSCRAAHAADGAQPLGQNGFKIELLRRTVRAGIGRNYKCLTQPPVIPSAARDLSCGLKGPSLRLGVTGSDCRRGTAHRGATKPR